MESFGLLLKSYIGDLDAARRLISSFHAHNPESLTLYVVVPEEDLDQFNEFAAPTVVVMSELTLSGHLVDHPLAGLRAGYINQEIVKLAFHELGLLDNYFCVDSDAQIIRDIRGSEFMAPDGYPYTVLVEDKDLKADPIYYRQYWEAREASIRKIYELIGLDEPIIRTCHGHQVFSSEVLRSFKEDFLSPRGWDYRDALAEAPYEFSWYNAWLLASGRIPIHQREPFVKVFHHERQHQEAVLLGITREDWARSYVAVVVNASFARELVDAPVTDSKPRALSAYLSYGEVVQLVGAKVHSSIRRRFRRGPESTGR